MLTDFFQAIVLPFAVRPFVTVEDYLTFQTYFVEQAKKAFDQAGIAVPIALQNVQLVSDN